MPPTRNPRPSDPARRLRRSQRGAALTRAEFSQLVKGFNERADIINELRANQQMQFKRLAQLQAEVDLLRRAWERVRPR